MTNDVGQLDILTTVVNFLKNYKISYLLTGSLAVSNYGFIRATHDIDIILEIEKESFEKIKKMLSELGSEYDYSLVDVKDAIAKSSQFNIYHLPTGLKIDFWIAKNDDFDKNKFRRSTVVKISNQDIRIVSAEDLILNKLKWCKAARSERHLRDCAGIWKVQGDKLDSNYLTRWAKKLKVEKLLAEIKEAEY